MDPFAMTYYAAVCALLGVLAPTIPNVLGRMALGIAVGIAASQALPFVRAFFGL